MAGKTDAFKFSATLQLNSRSKAFANKSNTAVEDAMRKVLKKAKKLAQENVAKGKGPSDHNGDADSWGHHFAHEDTGDLAESVQDAIWLQGFLTEGTIYTDLDYGVYLEVGWRTRQSNFYRYPWLKPAFLEALKLLPKYAAESMKYHMSNLEEEEILDGEGIESWANAAERWAKEMKRLAAEKKEPKKEVRPKYEPKFTSIGRYVNKNAERNRGGRPKDPTELGEEMELDRRRAVERKRRIENDKKFDAKIVRKTRKSSEYVERSSIDPVKAASEYEKKRDEMENAAARRRRERKEAIAAAQAEARRKQDDAIEILAKANDKLKKAATPNVKSPKPKRTPSVKPKPRKKKP